MHLEGRRESEMTQMTYRQAIRQALADSMEEDKNVILIGEDVGVYGGCFKVSEGLIKQFPDQVIDTPVSEEGFTGMAIGAAMMGMRPVIEIMYADFFTLIFDPIVNHAAKTHFLSAGQFSCPIVIRLPEGSGTGHGAQHTQSPEALFLNESGLKMVAPSNPSDAYNLLRKAVKDNNPVLFFEHKLLYDTTGPITPENIEIGRAKVLSHGEDLTIISYSHAMLTALETADLLSKRGIESTIVDLCSLKPLDSRTLFEQVRRTGRAVMIQDTAATGSVGSEVLALIASDKKTFDILKDPPLLICGKNSPTPFSKDLEKNSVPNAAESAEKILTHFFNN